MYSSELIELKALIFNSEGISGDVISRGMLGKGNQQESNKGKFKRLATKIMKEIGDRVSPNKSVITFNAGGSAISGECYLTTEDGLLMMINPDVKYLGILYRTGNGQNQWLKWDDVEKDSFILAECLLSLRPTIVSIPLQPVKIVKKCKHKRNGTQ